MRKKCVLAAVVFQIAVILYMAGTRELLYLMGRHIFLRTAPRDPQDPFRGDYVHLDYDISTVPVSLWRDSLPQQFKGGSTRKNLQVYVTVKEDEEGVVQLESLSDKKPATGLFLRGKINQFYGNEFDTTVAYGLESYFVQQGQGGELERGAGTGLIQIPLEMEALVGTDGSAILKSHRWCRLGIGADFERDTSKERKLIAIKLQLQNASDKPLAIVDLPKGGSFRLANVRGWSNQEQQWVKKDEAAPKPTAEDVHLLQPKQIYEIRIDLKDPAWFVAEKGKPPQSLSDVQTGQRFRMVYSPPSKADCANLPQAEQIWHGKLGSRAFAGGRFD